MITLIKNGDIKGLPQAMRYGAQAKRNQRKLRPAKSLAKENIIKVGTLLW